MADRDFNIKVVTTADTTGIEKTQAGLDRLAAQRQKAFLAPIPPELSGLPVPRGSAETNGSGFESHTFGS